MGFVKVLSWLSSIFSNFRKKVISFQVYPSISYASVASSENLQAKKDLLLLSQSTFNSPYKQYFSFPFDLMKYILKNPKSSNGLLKLYKTCKYFYSKNQVLIVSGKIFYTIEGALYPPGTVNNHGLPEKNISKLKAKLWLTNDIITWNTMPLNLSRIYRSTIKRLFIYRMEMNIETFKLLTSENSIEIFIVYWSSIRDANAKNVPIYAILPFMSKLKKLLYDNINEKFPLETLQKLNSVKFENKVLRIVLYLENVSETFDPKLLFEFIKQNISLEAGKICLRCTGNDSEAIKMNLKSVEKELFPIEKRSETFEILYEAPLGGFELCVIYIVIFFFDK